MRIDPSRLGFDIDGVVADTACAFLRIAAHDYGINWFTEEDIREFDVTNCLDMDPQAINDIFHRLMIDPLSEKMQPMPYAISVLEDLATEGPLTFITARPFKQPIAQWLEENLSDNAFRHARIAAMGEHDGKSHYLKKLGIHFFIDDRAETCKDLAEEGFTPIVFEQPWNRNKHDLASVSNWLEIRRLCFQDSFQL